jgi:hypothetical protein
VSHATAPSEVVVLTLADGLLAVDARIVLSIVRAEVDEDAHVVPLAASLGRREASGPSYGVRVQTERGPRTLKLTGRAEIVPVAPRGYMPLPARFAGASGGVYAALVRLEARDGAPELALALDASRLGLDLDGGSSPA